jgi:hypothetical protein
MPTFTSDAHNLGSETKKATGIPMFMGEQTYGSILDTTWDSQILDIIFELLAIGQCGSVLGSHLYPKSDGPKYMCVSRFISL